MFRWIRHTDHLLILLEIGPAGLHRLQAVPTRLVAETLRESATTDRTAAVAAYNTLLFLGGVFYNAVWHRARRRHLLIPGLDPARIQRESWRNASGPLAYLLAVPVAFLSVPVALTLDLLVIAAYLVPGPDLQAEDARIEQA